MALALELSPAIRSRMLLELDRDVREDCLYFGSRLTASGRAAYASLLREAITRGDDRSLELDLETAGYIAETETARHPRGGPPIVKRVPFNAAATLAEGEFNRFYLRGLCVEALESGLDSVVIYRARESSNPRSASIAMIGSHVGVRALLADLRANIGVDTALGLPPGPNSGLSARLPTHAQQAA